jgi:predicted dehydrogenase
LKVLVGNQWREGFLDEHRHPDEYRIEVMAWKNLEKLENLYFIRPKSLRLLWNYLRELGLVEVWRKILSRTQERYRNQKYLSCGLGCVIESADKEKFCLGQIVAFLAPSHPPCLERIVLPSELMIRVEQSHISISPEHTILYQRISSDEAVIGCWWADIRGWSRHSGKTLLRDTSTTLMQKVLESISQTHWQEAIQLQVDEGSLVTQIREHSLTKHFLAPKTAALFGYGNYAKTIILHNVKPYLAVDCIHELDPTQIPCNGDSTRKWDTSPSPRIDEDYDVFLIAGFHHTHAPLAIHALQQNAIAVVEKPIVTTNEQLSELLRAMQNSSGQLFSCFHKRYLSFNKLAIQDLERGAGEPISYHCIVYEVPLPELHWYRWPNSKSRLVSNGCHWIDHFLYLNDFCEVRSFNLVIAPDNTINCSITLDNDAFFTMVLTDKGSERIGVQDYIELRVNSVTVKMINGSDYVAETQDRVIRKQRINKMESYKVMYQQIGKKIVSGTPGDSLESVTVSAGLIVGLENKLIHLNQQGITYDKALS